MSELISRIAGLAKGVPGLRPDISFQQDDAYRFLPRMVALVVTVVVFMLLLAISLGEAISHSSNTQRDTILIHIPAQDGQDDIASTLLAALKESADVKQATKLSQEDLTKQMQPWLGDIEHAAELPVPTLIRAELAEAFSDKVLANLRSQMQALHSSAIVDAPAEWSANYSRFSKTIQWVLGGFSAALLLGMFGLMSFVSATAMKLHRRTVTLLHSIGSTDNYIAAQFQVNTSLLALKGALLGSIVASLAYAAIGGYVNHLDAAMLPDLVFRLTHAWVVVLLPLLAALVGFLSGRFASLHYLKRLM